MNRSTLAIFLGEWLPKIEFEIRDVLGNSEAEVAKHYGMMHYHMGWVDENLRPVHLLAGKRLRPIFLILACAEVGGDPLRAIPAAAAVELLHNFSLIHDDIEDGDEARRHRPTVWKVWGVPQAINAGMACLRWHSRRCSACVNGMFPTQPCSRRWIPLHRAVWN